jgi:phosphoglycolate phosphatase-like HAD superfamily hydrolase
MKKNLICFDMDGTIADLYAVENWLEMLRAYNARPYEIAEPMWDMVELNMVLAELKANGYEIAIITWLSKDSTAEYDNAVRLAKRQWLENMGFEYDYFHGVKYGTTKANTIRRYMDGYENAILIDDNDKVRNGWTLGGTINPVEENIIEVLKGLL